MKMMPLNLKNGYKILINLYTTMAIVISHVAIINSKNQLLILRRSIKDKVLPGYWDLPGGTVRLKEGPEAGAIREAKEECGLEGSGLRPLACVSNWDSLKQEKFVTIIFYCRRYKGRIKLNLNDHEDYAWVSQNDLKDKKIVDYLKLKLLNRSNI
jgi:8-oxo-dGTP diphosphatase